MRKRLHEAQRYTLYCTVSTILCMCVDRQEEEIVVVMLIVGLLPTWWGFQREQSISIDFSFRVAPFKVGVSFHNKASANIELMSVVTYQKKKQNQFISPWRSDGLATCRNGE